MLACQFDAIIKMIQAANNEEVVDAAYELLGHLTAYEQVVMKPICQEARARVRSAQEAKLPAGTADPFGRVETR